MITTNNDSDISIAFAKEISKDKALSVRNVSYTIDRFTDRGHDMRLIRKNKLPFPIAKQYLDAVGLTLCVQIGATVYPFEDNNSRIEDLMKVLKPFGKLYLVKGSDKYLINK